MEARYFNKWESDQAYSLIKVNPLEAKLLYEKYLEKYPRDYYTYPYYISVLIILSELEKAEDVLENVMIMSNNDVNFLNDFDKVKLVSRTINLVKLRLLVIQEKYEEAYKFYLENSYIFENDDIFFVILWCKRKLGKIDESLRDSGNTYIEKQILDYQEADFLEHIKKHLVDYNADALKPNSALFAFDFPINDAIEEIKKYIPSNKKLCMGFYTDYYVFKYERCGRCDDRVVDYFKVVCFHNTSDMITVFPSNYCSDLPYVDLNYMIEEKGKVKQLSQIDKFNRKWRR